jgi:maltose O-acetyltransferase
MKTEFQKMRSEELYDFSDPEIHASLVHAKEACLRLNQLTISSPGYREALRDVVPGIPDSTSICPPFYCDHGNGITIGERSFLNYGCVILDGARVIIGNDVKIGPNCQLLTPQHPIGYEARRGTCETSYPVEIGDDTWLGGGVVVCPGVKIGKRCIIAAGSVVIRDIPDDSMAAGNPAIVKKGLG